LDCRFHFGRGFPRLFVRLSLASDFPAGVSGHGEFLHAPEGVVRWSRPRLAPRASRLTLRQFGQVTLALWTAYRLGNR